MIKTPPPWTSGTFVAGGALVGTFDWELVADTEAERRAAAASAAWICAFNARWQVALLDHDLSDDYPHVIQVQQRQDDYLALTW